MLRFSTWYKTALRLPFYFPLQTAGSVIPHEYPAWSEFLSVLTPSSQQIADNFMNE